MLAVKISSESDDVEGANSPIMRLPVGMYLLAT